MSWSQITKLKIWSDIRFWLLFFMAIRLIGITNAPLEMGHNWRQSLTAMIARNFYELGPNLLYPRIDIAGEHTGIIGSEFPFFNYLIYLVSSVFGYAHWYGRLINMLVTSVGIFYYYKLISETLSEKTAFYSAFLLSTSVWFGFGRKIMPDTFSVALIIIGIYFGYRYIKLSGVWNLALFFTLSTLGMLCKIPAISLFASFGIVAFIKNIPFKRTLLLYTAGALAVAIVCSWYFYWVPYLVSTYGYELYFPRSLYQGLYEVFGLWPELLEKFYFVAFSSFIAFACFLGGLYSIYRDRAKLKWGLLAIGCVSFVFFIFIIKTGIVFPLHSYYIVPFVPVMALIAGHFFTSIKPKYAYILLGLITIESVANQQDDFFLKQSEMYKLTMQDTLDEHIPKDALVVINGTPSPQCMYFAHRSGWTENSVKVGEIAFLDSLTNLGASHLIWIKKRDEVAPMIGSQIYTDQHFSIFELD